MIGLFNECFPPVMDGVSLTVQNYARELYQQGHEVSVVTPNEPGLHAEAYPYAVYSYFSVPVPMRHPYRCGLPFFDFSYQRAIESVPFGIVHAHSPFSSGKEAQRLSRHLGIPMVATFHSKYRDDFSRVIQNDTIVDHIIRQIVQFYESADQVWIPQESVGETLRSYGYRGPMTVVENGSEFSGAPCPPSARRRARRMLLVEDDEPILLFVGQHIWEKNVRLIIEALAQIKDMRWQMYFVGDGYARQEMMRLCAKHGLYGNDDCRQDRVSFLGTIRDRQMLQDIYLAADLFLFPSMYDNAPLVLREAAALHTPALVLCHSNTSEVIIDGVNGFLADNDVMAYARRLRYLLSCPSLIHAAAEKASRTLTRPWSDIAAEVYDRYRHLVARKQAKVG